MTEQKNNAVFVDGFYMGRKGSPKRLSGSLLQSSSAARQEAYALGLPRKITGNPLGCTCREAYLSAVGKVVNGHVEADYQCYAGWHNYVLFEVRKLRSELKKEQKIKLDVTGQVAKEESFTAGDLETY